MNFEEIVSENTNSSNSQFWKAIGIWMRNPHVVNRRILASQELLTIEVSCNVLNIFECIGKLQIQPDDFECNSSSGDVKYLLDILSIAEYCQSVQCTDPIEAVDDDKTYLCVRKLLPRNTQIFSPMLELVFIDKRSVNVTSFHKPIVPGKQSLSPNMIYKIQHREHVSTCINVCKSNDNNYGKGCDWLKSKFFPRLTRWMSSENDSAGFSRYRFRWEVYLAVQSTEREVWHENGERVAGEHGSGKIRLWGCRNRDLSVITLGEGEAGKENAEAAVVYWSWLWKWSSRLHFVKRRLQRDGNWFA